MLKLQAGSTEAGYLAAIFPLPKSPTLVIMNKGQLKEYIAAGVSREDFISRAAKALGAAPQPPPSAPASASTQPSSAAAATPPPAPAQPASQSTPSQLPPASAPPTSTPASTPTQPQPSPQIQSLLTERAARLEAQRKREREEAAERRRRDKGKAKEESQKPRDPAQEKYSEELRRRQKQAREDRARVLQAIEDDKAARRAREAERAAARAGVPVSVEQQPHVQKGKEVGGGGGGDGKCKLRIRLFDGSTVGSRWDGAETLRGGVRPWLDEQPGMKGVAGSGYGFKVVLTPAPSRTIGVDEEEQTLEELGLAPSATLVLVPAAHGRGAGAGAYAGAASGNPIARVVVAMLGLLSGLWALVVGFLGSLLGTGTGPAPAVQGSTGGDGTAVPSGRDQSQKGELRRLRSEREKKDGQQFYNGNSVRLLRMNVVVR